MSLNSKYSIIFWLLVLLVLPLKGQLGRIGFPPIHNYHKQDYKAETQNWSVQQDPRGLIYFGNNLGLLEFDGNNWKSFTLPNKSIIRSLAIDSLGIIYVGGQDELGYFKADDNGILKFYSQKALLGREFQRFEDIWEIFITKEGIFWGTYETIFLQREDSISIFQTNTRFDNLFLLNEKLYVGESQVGIKVWENDSLSLIPAGDFFADKHVVAILPHDREGLLIVTRESGIYHYFDGEIAAWGENFHDFLIENRPYCGVRLKNGNLAIGTSHNGLIILDDNGNPIRIINKQNGLLDNSVLSMIEDNNGGLWLGLDNGVSYVEIQSPFYFVDNREGIKGSGHSSVVHDEHIYMATNQGIFSKKWLNPTPGINLKQFVEIPNSRGPTWEITKLDETLLVGKHTGAYELKEGLLDNCFDQTGVWKFMKLRQNPQYALVGTYDGLLLFKKSEGNYAWKYQTELKGIDFSSRVMEEDNEGNIWISHPYRGVYKITLNSTFSGIENVDFFNSENGFPSDLSIYVVRIQNEILFTTEKGVYYFDEANKEFLPHSRFNELLGEETLIHRLIEDEAENIWFSAGEEFGRFRISNNAIEKKVEKINFNQLQSRLVKGFQHIYAFDQNNIFIGIDDGFIVYDPNRDRDNETDMPIYIRGVYSLGIDDSTIFGGSFFENGRVVSTQPNDQIPSFSADLKDFRFSYSAAHFENLNEIQYQYKLEGKDENWSHWVHKTEKDYTNLAPGDYTFKVKARNTYGIESQVATYQFTILIPWYGTIWAKVFFTMLVIALFFLILYINTQRIKKDSNRVIQKQAQTLREQEEEFKREVEKSEAEIIRLKNEKLESEVVHKNKELASYALHLGQKSEMLLKLRKQLEKLKKEITKNDPSRIDKLIRMIDQDIRLDKNWEQFEYHFDQVHAQFIANLRNAYPVLTPKDQRLCAYLRMNLSTKEIAPLMGISVRGVEISRYRLRKKLGLEHDENLTDFIIKF